MSIFSKFFIKKQPVDNTTMHTTIHESETVTKARELLDRYEDLKFKIKATQNTIELLRYGLDEGKDNVVLRITRYEPGNYWGTYDQYFPIEHVLYLDEATKETLLRNMLSDYTKQLNEYEKDYKNL